jgi:hypothetical protein
MMANADPIPRRLGGRYSLLSLIGRGGHGEVWCARDHLTDDLVAVKVMEPSGCPVGPQARREIAALRAVQLPGVVRFLDEGTDDGDAFLVMELVRGKTFPGRRVPAAWADIAETTRSLLEILAGVHAVGVVHQDITPGNVLVDEGRPTLLDFGVAWSGLDDESRRGVRSGTPAYMAPEQVEGAPVSSATDLYAFGSVLFEALTGRLPFESDDTDELMAMRCQRDAPPLASFAPDAPAAVVQLVDAMLQRDPARRPRDAREALARLDGRPSQAEQLSAQPGAPWSLDELRAMIVGPDRLFHVPEDGAAVLWARTQGERSRVRAEIDAWVRVGLARRDGDAVVLTRAAVDRLAQPTPSLRALEAAESDPRVLARAHAAAAAALRPGSPGRLGHLVFALPASHDDALTEVVAEAVAVARLALDEGQPGAGLAALAEAWLTARRVGEPVRRPVLREAFALWSELALVDGTPVAIDRAVHELDRAQDFGRFTDLVLLLRAALAINCSPARAFAEASAIPAFAEPALERWRHTVRAQSARAGPLERERATVEALRPWAMASRDPRDHAAFADWEAWTLYRGGRYVEASDRHLAAAAMESRPAARLTSLLSAASALLEAWLPERALSLATAASAVAAASRLPYLEARAGWVERAALYRLERDAQPDEGFVVAVKAAGVGNLFANVAMTEAAFAWRAGDHETGRALATEAFRRWTTVGRRWAPDMARALALACGAEARPDELELLTNEALVCPVPAAGLQVLALLAPTGARAPRVDPAELERLAALVPAEFWSKRAAILSTDEALTLLRAR